MTRAQIAMEYLSVMVIATIMLVGYLVLVGTIQQRGQDAQARADATEVADQLQAALILAAEVHDGFSQNITLPLDFEGQPYTVEAANQSIVVHVLGASAYRRTPPYTGSPKPGSDFITKRAGVITIS